ncbi:hypothetical protein LOCC1_G005951 [Lachnellula occidentalis]|uniref:DUF6604 domain-containing protein n=1 Tax=Lachnellula occidentalis TaxID=215460 RepID=A0A8H8RK07_9HELO|nr:hypothetical protein LOCC1_G005951 [Lachnellula occidentalis]
MALDPVLFNTYKQYKVGTASVITWLVNRSKETNVSIKLLPEPSGSKGSGRLKGKARAAKKENGPKHIVPLASILQFAKSIADTAKAMVPEKIIRTLEEVIAARSECSNCFEQQGPTDTSTQASNQKHQYFVEVLRETLQILKPLSRVPGPAQATKQKARNAEVNNDIVELQNRFDYLEVDEPTEWTSSALPPKTNNKIAGTFELEPSDEDVSFAIFCLFKDLTDIRHYVRQTWAEYREHQIAFTTAALTMNTAISIFRRLNEEFVAEFPEFIDHGSIIKYLYNGYCDPNSHEENSQDFASYTGANFKVSSKIFFCDLTYEILRTFFMATELPFYKGVRSEAHLTQDDKSLLKCLSLFGLVAVTYKGNCFNDQLIHALYLLKTNNPDKNIYTWAVFAVQLFVDTRRVVGKERVKCLDEAQKLRKWMSTALKKSVPFGQASNVNGYYQLNSDINSGLRKHIDVVLKEDFVQTMLENYFEDRAVEYSWGSFYLFLNHPMLVGLIVQQLLVHMHGIGIVLCGDQGAVITSIHLYNTAQQSGKMPKDMEWIDFEKVIQWQSPSWIFVGDRPQSPEDCFRHYSLVMGTSATAFSKDRRGKSTHRLHNTSQTTMVPMSQKRNRRLKFVSTYVDLMYEFVRKGKYGGFRSGGTRAATEPLVMLEMLVAKYLKTNAETAGVVVSTAQRKVHPLSMITIFKDCLKSEEAMLRFDLLALNQRCVELLRKVQRYCVELSPLDYPRDEYDSDGSLNSCFIRLLAGESGLECYQPTRFYEACLTVKEMIAEVGDEEYGKSQSRSFINEDGGKKVTDPFHTPTEDVMSLAMRSNFGRIIIDTGSPEDELTWL